jgi:hypothetical protein
LYSRILGKILRYEGSFTFTSNMYENICKLMYYNLYKLYNVYVTRQVGMHANTNSYLARAIREWECTQAIADRVNSDNKTRILSHV